MLRSKTNKRQAVSLKFNSSMLSILLFCSVSLVTADTPANIRKLMAPEDYAAAGLEKLSDEELAHLSQWMEKYREGAVKGPPPAPKPVTEMSEEEIAVYREKKEEEKTFALVARVIPSFTGWSGKTVFHLDNGQVWQQRQTGKMRYSGGDATVVISRNVMGRYVMKHPDSGRAVGVKRIR